MCIYIMLPETEKSLKDSHILFLVTILRAVC